MEPTTSPTPDELLAAAAEAQQDPETVLATLRSMVDDFVARLPYVTAGIIIFVLFLFLAKGLQLLIRRFTAQRKKHRNLGLVLGRLAQFTMVLVGLLIALVIMLPGFTPGRLIELLGLSSIAIGFAFKDILQNFLAGILILLTEPFRLNDQIIFGNYEGTVEEIETRATHIRTYDGRRVVIPNAELFTNAVLVNTAFDKRRLQYDVGIGYGDDIETAKQLMLEAVQNVDGVLSDPAPDVLVVELAGSSVNIRLRWWIQPPRRGDALDTQDRVMTAVKAALTAHGIDLPFPTQQILFHDQTEETDGDRRRQREGWPTGKGEVPAAGSIATALRQLADTQPKADGRPTAVDKRHK